MGAIGRLYLLLGHRQQCCVFSQWQSIHRISQDSCWQQSGTTHILINGIYRSQRPCSALWWFDRDSKRPSVKADLAIYSYVLSVSG